MSLHIPPVSLRQFTNMAGPSWTPGVVFAMQFLTTSVFTIYHPNHKYDESDFTHDGADPKHAHKIINLYDRISSGNHVPSQIRSPLSKEVLTPDSTESGMQGVEKKLTSDENRPAVADNSSLTNRRSYENFVTQMIKIYGKGYEVTTEQFEDTEPDTTPHALRLDNDVEIALDDKDIEHHIETGTSRPEHLNPLVYLDSYGRLHGKGQSPKSSQGFGYAVVHSKKPTYHPHASKATGRVRIQVFRGPTRTMGHKKYAPWGYFVIQPADNRGRYSYSGPPASFEDNHGPYLQPGPPYNY